jgi:hypothetical protein
MKEKLKIPENNMSFSDQDDLRQISDSIKDLLENNKNVPIDKKTLKMLEGFFQDILRVWLKNNNHYIRLLKHYEDDDSSLSD